MTTWQMIRCKDCDYLTEGNNGEWICEDWESDIHTIENIDCALYAEEFYTDETTCG